MTNPKMCYTLIAYQINIYAIADNLSELINEADNFCLLKLG
ncbi:MAG: hypothetical protein ACK5JB_05195 [Pseudanabaena sp.]